MQMTEEWKFMPAPRKDVRYTCVSGKTVMHTIYLQLYTHLSGNKESHDLCHDHSPTFEWKRYNIMSDSRVGLAQTRIHDSTTNLKYNKLITTYHRSSAPTRH